MDLIILFRSNNHFLVNER